MLHKAHLPNHLQTHKHKHKKGNAQNGVCSSKTFHNRLRIQMLDRDFRIELTSTSIYVGWCKLSFLSGIMKHIQNRKKQFADYGINHIFYFIRQKDLSLNLIFCLIKHFLKCKHLPKDRSRFGQCKGCRRRHLSLRRRQNLVDTMTKFVSSVITSRGFPR